jgi:MtfA peptidase
MVRREEMDEDVVVHIYDDVISGEAMPGGPVVLSWEDVKLAGSNESPGYNVVIHEFAHKIDMLKGDATGVPPFSSEFHRELNGREFEAELNRAYALFTTQVDAWTARGEPEEDAPLIDPYAAEHPAEFFAVLSEAFFTQPEPVRDVFPDMYHLLKAYYRQNPLG